MNAALVGFVLSRPAPPSPEHTAAVDAARSQARDASRRALQELEEQGYVEADPEAARNLVESIEKVAEGRTGVDRLVTAFSARWLERHVQLAKPYNERWADFEAVGSVDASSVTGREDLDRRLAAFDAWFETLAPLEEHIRTAATRLADRIRQEFPNADATRIVGEWEASASIPAQLEVQRLERQAGQTMREILVHLRDRWGSWEYDPAQEAVVWDSDTDRETFVALIDRLVEQAEAQAEIQRRILERGAGN